MSRTTIDFGIDLGTTNSAIAIFRGGGEVTEVFKNAHGADITPSAVYIDGRRQTHIGQMSKSRLADEAATDDMRIEFKREMGSDCAYEFKAANRTMTAEELSAEVLKSLKGDVYSRLGEDVKAAVITVPAAFMQKQCVATKKAGELAGFLQCPLLQEPVAAALAYGFRTDVAKEYWFVYDFGGGTFDAAVLKAEDGTVTVVNHGGDEHLGGSDIDWAIVEKMVQPELVRNYNLPEFSRGNGRWKATFWRVKHAVEEAKIQLSRKEAVYLEGCRIRDADGKEHEVEFQLTRNELVSVAEPIIMRSAEICKRVLKEKNLTPAAIERVILVGGPTLAPYFREILKSSLEITLDCSVDPLTVVARGAAIFAATQRLEGKAAPRAGAGQFEIELHYKPVGSEEDPAVRGRVKSESGVDLKGFSIEFVQEETFWRSGKIILGTDGRFRATLVAEKGRKNSFAIELSDAQGSRQITVPDRITYTIGLAISDQPIIHSVAIALANNDVDVFFKKGDALPAKAMKVYRTTVALKRGESGSVLRVPVVEGEEEKADHNPKLGTLEISGSNISRDVPAGSEIEVSLVYDASRMLYVTAYVPMLDEEFSTTIESDKSVTPRDELSAGLNAGKKRLEVLTVKVAAIDAPEADEILSKLEDDGVVEEIENLVDAAGGGAADPANNASLKILRLRVELDKVEDLLERPGLVEEANTAVVSMDELVLEYGTPEQEKKATQLRNEIEALIEGRRAGPLRRKIEQVHDVRREILYEQPGFWVGFLKHLIDQRDKMKDQAAADALIRRARQAIDQNNLAGLRQAVWQLLELLPREVAEKLQRGYDSGILK